MKFHKLLFISFISFSACTYQPKEVNNELSQVKNKIEKVDTIHKLENELVSDTLKKIIDELNLCEYSAFLKDMSPKNYNCYAKDICDIRNIKAGDYSYNNFIFQAPGGSAGGAIIIFSKKNEMYYKVQEFEGVIDSITPQTTNSFYDLILWHRAHKPGGESVLYKWNGKAYIRVKIIRDWSKQ